MEREGVGRTTDHCVHLAEVRHWKWTGDSDDRLIPAPAHPFSAGLPVVHLLWQWKKSPKGYRLGEAMLEPPSTRYGTHMEGHQGPAASGGGEASQAGDHGSNTHNAPGIKNEMKSETKREI